MSQTLIKIDEVSMSYGDSLALDQVSLEITRAEVCSLVGASGSGKSTLMKCMNGLLEPQQGRVFFEDQNIANLNSASLRKKFGYVIQEGGLFPHLKIWENISIMGKTENQSVDRRRKKSSELLRKMNLDPEEYAERYPLELSGGERQRVGIARALFLEPEVLLMDEPFGALDPITRKELQESFKKLVKELGKTVVLVTHDLSEACELGDNIAVMESGKIIQFGSVSDVSENPEPSYVKKLFEDFSGLEG